MRKYVFLIAVMALTFGCCSCFSVDFLGRLPPEGIHSETPAPVAPAAAEFDVPDFTLAALDGSTVTLSNLYGQVIVIDFWTTWCGPCVESLPHLQNVHERYADRGVTVLAINIEESSGEISQFVGGRYTFPILLDQDGKVSDAYRVWAIPYTLVIDQTGSSQEIPMGPMGVESVVVELLNP